MELKRYQKQVLLDIERFISECNSKKEIRNAYKRYWELKAGVSPSEGTDIPPYRTTVARVPRVTVKVPTAGGKTFIACNAICRIFRTLDVERRRMVLWFVPNDAILEQTLGNLRNTSHPYRACLDVMFGGRVRVYDKEELLTGKDFTPDIVTNQLSIAVLSISSFASSSKDFLRVKRENGHLMAFEQMVRRNVCKLQGIEPSALIQVLNAMNPVVINDESHNFRSELRLEVLKQINPSFILELTATPRENSNIISFVDAKQLKDENMVKLPVIVYNNTTKTDVLLNSIQLRNKLELEAKAAEADGGKYIRPIVLFQAEPRTSYDSETFDKIKSELIEVGIPEEQIKIKTSNRNELKGVDLMSRDCPVRYIITVNALKEGWDCPFAYILASLSNRSSKIDVEQILGRILRLPYTAESRVGFLNMGYVFTSSNDFQQTISSIIDGLQNSGYSAKDYRSAEIEESYTTAVPMQLGLFDNMVDDEPEPVFGVDVDSDSVDTVAIREALRWEAENEATPESVNKVLNTATQQSLDFFGMMAEAEADGEPQSRDLGVEPVLPAAMTRDRSTQMKAQFKNRGEALRIPLLTLKVENVNGFIGDSDELVVNLKLERESLCEGFDLDKCNREIDLQPANIEVRQIDLEEQDADEFVPKAWTLNEEQISAFKQYILTLATEEKINQLAKKIAQTLNYDVIPQPAMLRYVSDIIGAVDIEQLEQLTDNIGQSIQMFKQRINALLREYAMKRFAALSADGLITAGGVYALPKTPAVICRSGSRVPKSLYKDEEAFNGFAADVIAAVAALPGVDFWHHNPERGRGFFIAGFINQYPDFIVRMTNGVVVLVDVAAADDDVAVRIAQGRAWQEKSGREGYRYFYVSAAAGVNGAGSGDDDGAVSLQQLIDELATLK